MDDPIFTEEITADYLIQQMDNNDFFAALKMNSLAIEGDKSAKRICSLIEDRCIYSFLKQNKTNI